MSSVMCGPRELVLNVRGVGKTFSSDRAGRSRGVVNALDGINLDLYAGEMLGVAGESGSGKSTLARVIAGLEAPSEGSVEFTDTSATSEVTSKGYADPSVVQYVYQDPSGPLNPRRPVGWSIAEPLRIHNLHPTREAMQQHVGELMEAVGLNPALSERYPRELSGGQLQRVNIARALALRPTILLLDEPVSALDVSVQSQVMALLSDLRLRMNLAMLMISHDLALVSQVCDRIAVIYLGRIVEVGNAVDVICNPAHPYTKRLIAAVPSLDVQPGEHHETSHDFGTPDPDDIPSGCRYRTRCAQVTEICAATNPVLLPETGSHAVACHHNQIEVGVETWESQT